MILTLDPLKADFIAIRQHPHMNLHCPDCYTAKGDDKIRVWVRVEKVSAMRVDLSAHTYVFCKVQYLYSIRYHLTHHDEEVRVVILRCQGDGVCRFVGNGLRGSTHIQITSIGTPVYQNKVLNGHYLDVRALREMVLSSFRRVVWRVLLRISRAERQEVTSTSTVRTLIVLLLQVLYLSTSRMLSPRISYKQATPSL